MAIPDIKRTLFGEPFPTSQEIHERLDKVRGLAVFASDTISSNAYATEAIMTVLIVLGSGALVMTMPLAIAVAVLVLLVIFSYIQTIVHYPGGGGAYIVSKDNLGMYPSLMAGAALLIDYVLTVAVSTSAGVRAVTSALPELYDYRVIIALAAIAFITWVNLRGMRESGTIFALPTYLFVLGVMVTIVIGLARYSGLFGLEPLPSFHESVPATASLTGFAFLWLLLRAFAGGCTAMTGIEAISDGVSAFKPPESRNAVITMVAMGIIAMALFLGIAFLSTAMHLIPTEHGESILSQMTRQVTGTGIIYYWVQIFTALILFLAANTGYQDFPRLSSFLAKDGYLPRWMQNRGDRLVFSSGITVLAVVSALVVIIFQADEIAMLPLYALGVMLSFTLSQSGMSHLMRRIGRLKPGESAHTGITTIHYEPRWHWKWGVNIVGAITTGIVFMILMATKFLDGAWIVVLAIPMLVFGFHWVNKHYQSVAQALSTRELEEDDLAEVANVAIVPMADVHRGTLQALQYARRIATDVRAVCIATTQEMHERVERRWARFPKLTEGIKLIIIDYDYRDILTPLVEYIETVNHVEFPEQLVTIVIPEFVPAETLGRILHNQTANLMRRHLRSREDVIVIDVPFHIPGANEPHAGTAADQPAEKAAEQPAEEQPNPGSEQQG